VTLSGGFSTYSEGISALFLKIEHKKMNDEKILKIAVTGSAGSGKSLVCERLKELGLFCLDCDRIARQVVEPRQAGYNEIIKLFGKNVLLKDSSLDRSALRKIIINDPLMKNKMEEALHPLILDRMMLEINTAEYGRIKAVAVEVPLLFETGMDSFFDLTVAVIAQDQDLVKRIAQRDSVREQDAQKMLGLQMSQEEKQDRADYVIVNSSTPSELFKSVDFLFHHYLFLSTD
jgi:dephospho-CoA kinase